MCSLDETVEKMSETRKRSKKKFLGDLQKNSKKNLRGIFWPGN